MKNQARIWKFLFGITSLLFFIIGFAKIIEDKAALEGSALLVFALFLLVIDVLVFKEKIVLDRTHRRSYIPISLGFIFLVIGAVTLKNYGLAGFGFILMLLGMLRNNRSITASNE